MLPDIFHCKLQLHQSREIILVMSNIAGEITILYSQFFWLWWDVKNIFRDYCIYGCNHGVRCVSLLRCMTWIWFPQAKYNLILDGHNATTNQKMAFLSRKTSCKLKPALNCCPTYTCEKIFKTHTWRLCAYTQIGCGTQRNKIVSVQFLYSSELEFLSLGWIGYINRPTKF